MYDIFFVATRNGVDDRWNDLKSRFPRAQRINGPKNLEEIKKRSLTKFFYVVWDDICISDDFYFDYRIPTWDEEYIHIFKNEKHFDGVCIFSKNHSVAEKEFRNRFFFGKKEIDIVASRPHLLNFDIFFISYQEPNADDNWQKLKSRFSRAQRIHGVKGIHQAHLAAAVNSSTQMFYVVDGDAEICEDFSFEYYVPGFERDFVYVWQSENPINGLIYGYGGVKLLPTEKVLNMPLDSVDMTLSISTKFRSIAAISNVTKFNTDPFNTWKSAFRECVKLASKPIDENYDEQTDYRLQAWCSSGIDKQYGEYSLEGAKSGREYGYENIGDIAGLSRINDFDWLKEKYEEVKMNFPDKKSVVKNMLDKVGPGMCLAKWTQSTIHLGLGHTHSCHHPRTHVIPIAEIQKNPSALHNTEYKKLRRKEMLEGQRPGECNYCWNVEDLDNIDQFSDRVLKSSESWSLPYYNQIIEDGYDKDINPKYIEISFSNVCNFKCSYCMPSVSSQWMEEIERHGPYPTSMSYNTLDWVRKQNKMPIPVRENNPYIEAFWKWWPDLYKNVDTFRITGGEPLLDKNTYKILDYVIENPNPYLELCINSNLCVPEDLYEKFISKLAIIQKNNLVKKFTLYTSCEAHGSAAEYIRFGLDYKKWLENLYLYIDKISKPSIGVTATYNALSVTTFDLFLTDIKKVKDIIELKDDSQLFLDIPYLNNPPHQNVKILTEDFIQKIENQINYMGRLNFNNNEIDKLKRTATMMIEGIKSPSDQNPINRKDFVIFVDEHDRRRGTNFLETFPEMKEFYELCKKL